MLTAVTTAARNMQAINTGKKGQADPNTLVVATVINSSSLTKCESLNPAKTQDFAHHEKRHLAHFFESSLLATVPLETIVCCVVDGLHSYDFFPRHIFFLYRQLWHQ